MSSSNQLERNAAFADIDDLLNAKMEDLDGLPPLAIPPTGTYLLKVNVERKTISDKDALVTSYEVVEVLDVAEEEERSEVVVGQQFQNGTFTKKKDGKPNEFGIGAFKDSLVPYATHFFGDNAKTVSIGEVIQKLEDVIATVSLKRVQRKDGADDEYNFRIKSVLVM